MDALRVHVDSLVSVGIRSYIGLLAHGERSRSRCLFNDVLHLSALVSGGPSARISPLLISDRPERGAFQQCVILITLRSILATLLVLRTTRYWQRVPELARLHECCVQVAHTFEKPQPADSSNGRGHASGRTAVALNELQTDSTDIVTGCRRNDAIPTVPELAETSAPAAWSEAVPTETPTSRADCSIAEQYTMVREVSTRDEAAG